MISEITNTIQKLREEGFTDADAIQIIIANELNYIGVKLNELSNKE